MDIRTHPRDHIHTYTYNINLDTLSTPTPSLSGSLPLLNKTQKSINSTNHTLYLISPSRPFLLAPHL